MMDALIVVAVFAIGASSPGPANLMIMTTAMAAGRPAGLRAALGVWLISALWGVLAVSGFTAILQVSVLAFTVLKIIGAAYLIYLGVRMLVSAWRNVAAPAEAAAASGAPLRTAVIMHLTNPKAPIIWGATVSVGTHGENPAATLWLAYAGCVLAGGVIFSAYALLFSTQGARTAFRRFRRGINAVSGGVFCSAAIGVAATSAR